MGPVRKTARSVKPGCSASVFDMRPRRTARLFPLIGFLFSSRLRPVPKPSAIAVGEPRCPARLQSVLVWAIAVGSLRALCRFDRFRNARSRFSLSMQRRRTMSFRPVPKQKDMPLNSLLRRRTMSFRPVPKLVPPGKDVCSRRTMSFGPVPKPMRPVSAIAWHFVLEPPEKKQASRFNDLAHFCVLQVSTRVNSRARRGTEPYSTIFAPSRPVVPRARVVRIRSLQRRAPRERGLSFARKPGMRWPRSARRFRPRRAWTRRGPAQRSPFSKTLGCARGRLRQARGCAA